MNLGYWFWYMLIYLLLIFLQFKVVFLFLFFFFHSNDLSYTGRWNSLLQTWSSTAQHGLSMSHLLIVNCKLGSLGLWAGWGKIVCLRQAWNGKTFSFPWIPSSYEKQLHPGTKNVKRKTNTKNKHCVKVKYSVMSVLSKCSDPDTLLTCFMSLFFYWVSRH